MRKLLILTFSLIYVCLFGQGNFSALMFGDYFYNVQRDTLATTLNNAVLNDAKDLNGFRYRRIYLTYDYKFDHRFSAKINLESDQEANTSNGKFGFFLKDAYLKWDSLYKNISLQVGIISTPTFIISEKWWGHRYLEKTITNLRKIEESRDFGISFNGTTSGNKLFYTIMLGNNSGNKPEIDRFKSIYATLGYNISKNMVLTLSYTYHFYKKTLDLYDTLAPYRMLNKDNSLITFFTGYKIEDKFSMGIELFYQTINNNYNTGEEFVTYHSYGGTFYADIYLNEKFSLTGRIDYYEPNDYSKATNDRRIYGLLSYNVQINKSIIISPNVISEWYEKLANDTKIKPAITPRITFYWKY